MVEFDTQSMYEVHTILSRELEAIDEGGILEFGIPNPDMLDGRYSGSEVDGAVCHSWHGWSDLAHLLLCRMLTPQLIDDQRVVARFQKLRVTNSFHTSGSQNIEERYGSGSIFWDLAKGGESSYMEAFAHALTRVECDRRQRILDLGIHKGDEFGFIRSVVGDAVFDGMELVGIDHNVEAIEYARERFGPNVAHHAHDINDLDSLGLGKFDLIVTIGTLQSTNLNFKTLLMSLVQNYLSHDGAIIIGFTNCRWIDGEMIYGAKMPNSVHSDMSQVIKDIYFCKKYLQQHKFRVTVSGKEYLFLSATKIGIQGHLSNLSQK